MTDKYRVPVRVSPIRYVERDPDDPYIETWEYDVEYDDGTMETKRKTVLR